ncbi:MAG TPA: hypothetical protein VF611_15845 [Pyrinomonadaceae bacterium]
MNHAAAREQDDTETDAAGHGLRVPFSRDDGPHVSAGESPRARATRRRLAGLVAAKLLLDLLFVGAFALYTHAVTFRGGFDGALEHADGRGARGWVVDLERPGEEVEVQLFLDGRFAAAAVAREPRPEDSTGPSVGGARRAFVFEFGRPRYGEHEASVYAVRAGRDGARRTLRRVGGPLHFAWK